MENQFKYTQIIKQAFNISKRPSLLWFWGFVIYFFSSLLPQLIYLITKEQYSLESVQNITFSPRLFIIFIGIIIFVLLALYISSLFSGTLVLNLENLIQKKQESVKSLFKNTIYFGRKIAFLTFSITGVLFVLSFILLSPVIFLSEKGLQESSEYLGTIASLLLIIFFVIALVVWIYSLFFIVLTKQELKKSIILSIDLYKQNWKTILALFGLTVLISVLPDIISFPFIFVSGSLSFTILLISQAFFLVFAVAVWFFSWKHFTGTILRLDESVNSREEEIIPTVR